MKKIGEKKDSSLVTALLIGVECRVGILLTGKEPVTLEAKIFFFNLDFRPAIDTVAGF